MRKVLLILVMLMSVAMLAAETSVTVGGDTTSGSAKVKIVLPLDSEEFGTTVVVGFSTKAVDSSTAPTAPAAGEIELIKSASGNTAELSSGLHVYWQTNNPNANFTLKLYQEKALSSTNGTIDWTVTASGETLNGNADGSTTTYEYGDTEAITIDEVSTSKTIGSTAVTMKTADYTGKPLEEYSANLVLAVSVEE